MNKVQIAALRAAATAAIGDAPHFWEVSPPEARLSDKGRVALSVGAGERLSPVHWAYTQLIWTMEDDLGLPEEKVGRSTIHCRNVARYIAAASPEAVIGLIERIELLERALKNAGFTVDASGAHPMPEAGIHAAAAILVKENSSLLSRLGEADAKLSEVMDLAQSIARATEDMKKVVGE